MLNFLKEDNMKKIILLFMLLLEVQAATAGLQKDQHAKVYNEITVTPSMVEDAHKKAQAENKFLMIEFGANWCSDCMALARNMEQGQTRNYIRDHFIVLKVDVGQFNRNLDIAKSLGVDLNKGIPTAVFFAPDGKRVGATNKGELEPSAKYGTQQIYGFLKEIAERQTITTPGK